MRQVLRCISLAMLFAQGILATAADKYALLVGVTKYEHAEMNRTLLKYPEADAKAVGEMLQRSGYTVVLLLGKDASQKAIEDALNTARNEGTSDGVVLIGMFGHGVQYGNDAYYGPYNTKLREVKDFKGNVVRDNSGQIKLEPDPTTMISMRSILDALTVCGADSKILLADCCREDPSAARGRAFGSNLQKEGLPRGMAALFACSENEQAFESDDWGHGAFTKALLDECTGAENVTAAQLSDALYRRVSTLVRGKTRGKEHQSVNGIVNGFVDLKIAQEENPNSFSNSIGMKLILIPSGDFMMGTNDDTVKTILGADSEISEADLGDERPQHRVKISRSFFAGRFEVTQAEYEAIMGVNPCAFSSTGGAQSSVAGMKTQRFPVENVTWFDALEFCNRLSEQEGLAPLYSLSGVVGDESQIKSATVAFLQNPAADGKKPGYRLPTEAEWEYLCRSGTETTYHFGEALNGEQANVYGASPFGTSTSGPYLGRPNTVGSYVANAFGLHDVHGNVYEWCQDAYNAQAYRQRGDVTIDPLADAGQNRVLRGGSWTAKARFARSAFRLELRPGNRSNDVGFRVILEQ